jgi:hypothetical protein
MCHKNRYSLDKNNKNIIKLKIKEGILYGI